MVMLLIISLVLLVVWLIVYTLKMKNQNLTEYNQVEELKKRIDELDDDNVETTKKGTGKISWTFFALFFIFTHDFIKQHVTVQKNWYDTGTY